MREQTLKSVLVIINKLSDRTINGELLRYLAKTANDEQPGIRTNTTICLGKIAKNLGTSTRGKVLIAAFTRSLRDPFVHARNASLLALAVTADYFSDEDCAARIMPTICPLLIDKEKLIRDQAAKTIDVYVQKIRKAAAAMPDSALPPETAASGGPRMSTPQPAESSATASWAGWAISSFTNKLSAAAGEIQPTATPPNGAPSTTTGPKRPAAGIQTTSSASTLHRQALKSPPPSASLSRTSSSGTFGAAAGGDTFFPEPDAADDDGDAWGDMDEGAGDDAFWGGGDDNDTSSPPATMSSSTTLPKRETTSHSISKADKKPASASTTPFDDGSEPDFAGWLAAQAQKKSGAASGGLPKGLAKPSSAGAGARKVSSTVVKAKPAAAPVKKKVIDLKPKNAGEDDEDGWGGW